jgi:hypothetical protein
MPAAGAPPTLSKVQKGAAIFAVTLTDFVDSNVARNAMLWLYYI